MFASASGRIRRKHSSELVLYLEGKSKRRGNGRTEGYLEHGLQAVWVGRGCDVFGLAGEAHAREVTRILEGYRPERRLVDGEWLEVPITGDAGNPDGWAAIDFTLSVPKSVSVAWAISDESTRKAIESALTEASAAFIAHLEANAACMRRRDPTTGQVIYEKPAGLVAAAYRHDTARPVDGLTAPQLHDHILIAAVAPRRIEARGKFADFGKIETQRLYELRGEASAVASTVMVARLRELGFSVEREGTAWEICGIGKDVREALSPRAAQVQEALREMTSAQTESPSRAQIDLAVLSTRAGKEQQSSDTLFDDWRSKVAALGVSPTDLRTSATPETRSFDDRRSAVIDAAVKQLENTRASWKVGDLLLKIAIECEVTMSMDETVALLDEVRHAARNSDLGSVSPALIVKANGHLTSHAVLFRERHVLDRILDLAHSDPDANTGRARQAAKFLGISLSDDQAAAVEVALGNSVSLVEAPAGTGKGTVAKVVSAVQRAEGHRVIAVATSGTRAEAFGQEIDADCACTVERFVRDATDGRLPLCDGDTVLLDEVGQMETRRWDALLQAIDGRQVRLGLYGDREQLDAIEVGGLLRPLADAIPTATLKTNWRNAADADLWDGLRGGRAGEVLAEYDRRGQVAIGVDQSDAMDRLVADYHRDRLSHPHETALIVTDRSNHVIDEVNRRVQELSGNARPGVTVHYQEPDSDYVRSETLRVGDPVTATRQVNRVLQVGTGLHVNVFNGAVGTVVQVDESNGQVVVDFQSKGKVSIDQKRANRLRLAYCRHAYSAQGATVDAVYGLVGGWQTGKASGYVAVSRARSLSRIYSDRDALGLEADANREQELSALARAFTRDKSQEAALVALNEPGTDAFTEYQLARWNREVAALEHPVSQGSPGRSTQRDKSADLGFTPLPSHYKDPEDTSAIDETLDLLASRDNALMEELDTGMGIA